MSTITKKTNNELANGKPYERVFAEQATVGPVRYSLVRNFYNDNWIEFVIKKTSGKRSTILWRIRKESVSRDDDGKWQHRLGTLALYQSVQEALLAAADIRLRFNYCNDPSQEIVSSGEAANKWREQCDRALRAEWHIDDIQNLIPIAKAEGWHGPDGVWLQRKADTMV